LSNKFIHSWIALQKKKKKKKKFAEDFKKQLATLTFDHEVASVSVLFMKCSTKTS